MTSRLQLGISAAVLSLSLALAPAAFAQDKMGKDDGMKKDTMAKDNMKKDDGMKKNADGMKKDDGMMKKNWRGSIAERLNASSRNGAPAPFLRCAIAHRG